MILKHPAVISGRTARHLRPDNVARDFRKVFFYLRKFREQRRMSPVSNRLGTPRPSVVVSAIRARRLSFGFFGDTNAAGSRLGAEIACVRSTETGQ